MPSRLKKHLPPKVEAAPTVPPLNGKTLLRIGGMRCNGCVDQVTAALQSVDGVNTVDVDIELGEATVTRSPTATLDTPTGGSSSSSAGSSEWIDALTAAVQATGKTAEYVHTGRSAAAHAATRPRGSHRLKKAPRRRQHAANLLPVALVARAVMEAILRSI